MHTSEHFGKGGSYTLNPETDQIELAEERIQMAPEFVPVVAFSDGSASEEQAAAAEAATVSDAPAPVTADPVAADPASLEAAQDPSATVNDTSTDRPGRRGKRAETDPTDGGAA
ncbi:hypothetical protein [Methylococcus mesophilus]|uniref:hypothetical protein n=1 Tax=Methylococcus mesophilus TaxID=2993564 RepID=UPI00224B9275|nr:hypothetical protein [Methylococcus mesophilus]UZR27478.1 hypothetical protein OOT43_12110 [Methylococcus mesophilus]